MSNNKVPEFAEIKIGDMVYKMPIIQSSVGPHVIDINKLYSETGYFTYDPGFMSTAACESKITYIDGDQGILRHRGYDIKDLAQNCTYNEVAYLLIYGELPNSTELEKFVSKITHHSLVNEQLKNLIGGFRHSAHPMAIVMSSFGSLSSIYHEDMDLTNHEEREMAAIRMIAKIPTIAAMAYKYSIGQSFISPQNHLSYCDNFLNMLFATPAERYKVNPVLSDALDKIFILHADHEQNASTSTVRTAASSGANPYACLSAGIASLWGPAHGGANEAVINMLKAIGSKDNIPLFIAKAKDKNDPFRLMGFGHRVYKNYDPRANVLRETSKEVFKSLGQSDNPLLEIATELEKIALNDQYFVERKLYPNVDFYSGIIYEAMGIPSQLFTVLFAVARTAGWLSQWLEMNNDKSQKITRPRQLYIGHANRKFVNLTDR